MYHSDIVYAFIPGLSPCLHAEVPAFVETFRADVSARRRGLLRRRIKIWKVPQSKDRPHGLKYSFAYIVNDERVIGYDNYRHKTDHRHYRNEEYPYEFQGLKKLWQDFIKDIDQFREDNL